MNKDSTVETIHETITVPTVSTSQQVRTIDMTIESKNETNVSSMIEVLDNHRNSQVPQVSSPQETSDSPMTERDHSSEDIPDHNSIKVPMTCIPFL